MKYVFIINLTSGSNKSKDSLVEEIESYRNEYDISIYFTEGKYSATEYVKNYLKCNDNQEVRFIACGGDGTINEVANGIVGYKNANMTVYPCGTGDDFAKSVGGIEKYRNVKNLLDAKNYDIDLIKINDLYSINVANFGFDADVVKHSESLKGKVKSPYTNAIFKALFTSMSNDIQVEADGELLNNGKKMLLCNLGNGGYEGGKYFCAPYYKVDDGLIEVCYVKKISVFKLLSLIKCYEKGEHLSNKKLKNIIFYRQIKKAKISSKKEFTFCIDGELISGTEFNVEICPKIIKFAMVK